MHFKNDTIGNEIIDSNCLTLEKLKEIKKILERYKYIYGEYYEQICYDLQMHLVDSDIMPNYKVSDLKVISNLIDWLKFYPLVTKSGIFICSPYDLFLKNIKAYHKLDNYNQIIDFASGYLPNLSKLLSSEYSKKIIAVDPALNENDSYFRSLSENFTAYKTLPSDIKFKNNTLFISKHPCTVENEFIDLVLETKSSMSLELCNCQATCQAECLSKIFENSMSYEEFYFNSLKKQSREIAEKLISSGYYKVDITDITEDAVYNKFPVIHAETRPYKKLFIMPMLKRERKK